MSLSEFSSFLFECQKTLSSYFVGLFIASLLGWVSGLLLSLYKPIQKPFFILIDFIRPVPSIALIPFAILLFGIGDNTRQILAVFGAIWPILFNTVYGVANVDAGYIESGMSLGLSPLEIFFKIIIPASLPSVVTGIRTSSSIILIVIISTEMIIGNYGLGAFISEVQQSGNATTVYYAFVFTGILGYSLNLIMELLQNKLTPWNKGFIENL